jgi:phosphohistidine phosphatase
MRAITTAEKCAKAMCMNALGIIQDSRIYEAWLNELLTVLADAPEDAGRVMIVGHNPGLEDLLIFLSNDELPVPEDGKLLPTAALAHLEMPEDWHDLKQGCAKIRNYIRPRNLPDGFPFPAPDGDEQRERPAYYYFQSAVIPYRYTPDGSIEFLIISSSKNKHWVVPKGIREPGLTSQQSAEKEAWEEAGIRGDVDEALLGTYSVQKWGAECLIEVYAMQVHEVVEEDDWEERHRRRQWLTAEKAAAALRQAELGKLLLMLSHRLES